MTLREFWHYFNATSSVRRAGVCSHVILLRCRQLIAPYAGRAVRALLAPPVWQEGGSWAHILGTDDVGRDVLAPDVWRAFVTAGRLSGGRPAAGDGDYSRPGVAATSAARR